MSNTCGSCDCGDKTQCVKNGNIYGLDIVETQTRYVEAGMSGGPAAEHDGKCKCGSSCTCTDCTCGH